MLFKLTELGKIHEASIKLDGVTVIAGSNGSGKSTISRALFTWYTFLRQVGGEILRVRMESIGEELDAILKENGLPEPMASRFVRTYFGKRPLVKLADRSFWVDERKSRDWWRDHCVEYSALFSPQEDLRHVDLLYERTRERALYWIDSDESKIARFVLEKCFLQAFDGQIGTLFDDHATTTVSLENDDGIRQSGSFVRGASSALSGVDVTTVAVYNGRQMFYLEPRHLLDEVPTEPKPRPRRRAADRYSVNEGMQWEQILAKELDRKDMTLAQIERMKPILEELDEMVSVIRGEIGRDERKLVFKDADLPSGKAVSLKNIASGAKSVVAIVRGLRNDSIHPGDFLIVDEPESNLHPEWQLSFAKFLVLLHARFDMRILLNTHSPYFLKAIEVYSDLYEQGEDCAYYNMVKCANGQYDAKCVTDCLQEVFKAMSAPFSRLMHGEHDERAVAGR